MQQIKKFFKNTTSLYIHWPFCPYRCFYCPFLALAGQDEFMPKYHQALIREIEQYAAYRNTETCLNTVFIGGGTPSTYPEDLLLDMYVKLKSSIGIDSDYEFTIEVNPGTVTKEKVNLWKEIGINRLSIGVQSLNDKVLKDLNRHQKISDVYELMSYVDGIFENVSIDLIIGLPGVPVDEWKNYIKEVVTWPIKHISLYFLTIHEDTPLYFSVARNKVILPPDEIIVELYHWTRNTLINHGFIQYEISNFSKEGYESRHNSVYWARLPYMAIGLGACAFDGKRRYQNEKNLLKYLEGVEKNEEILIFKEELSDKQIWLEKLMLGLRQLKGVRLSLLLSDLDENQKNKFLKELYLLCELNMVSLKNDHIMLTAEGIPVANEVIVKLSTI